MKTGHSDKDREGARYEERARRAMETAAGHPLPLGAAGVAFTLRRPYERYEARIRELIHPDAAVLDLCCGDGQFSFVAAHCGARVTGMDLAPAALDWARQRCPAALQDRLTWVQGDCERLPFGDGAFDGVMCAGGLSYGDWTKVRDEVCRVLRPGGFFVAVDSYNHNPIYRLNRWIHHLLGRRTASVCRRIPSRRWLALWRERFPDTTIEHFDVLTFLLPVLRPLCGEDKARQRLEAWEPRGDWLREWAFKIVVASRKPAAAAPC